MATARALPTLPPKALLRIQSNIGSCRACPKMIGPPVFGPPIASSIFLLGQAPGPHEGRLGRPFAYTAGKTLFRWFETATGIAEAEFRSKVYMAAVARCFPGKAPGGGDRVPDAAEIVQCGGHLKNELEVLKPKLLIAVGKLAIAQSLGPAVYGTGALLQTVVGTKLVTTYHGHRADVICLPHPSGLSSWYKTEPGKTLLAEALTRIANHPAWRATFR